MMHDPTAARIAALRDASATLKRQRSMAATSARPAAAAFWRDQAAATMRGIDDQLDDLSRLRQLYPTP